VNQLVYQHEGQAVRVPLGDKPVSIGRGEAADHRLPDKTASRVHAQFILREGRWCVEDLESANGTLLNGKKTAGIVPLSPGDVIRVGATELKFEGPAPKPPPEPEQAIPRLVYQPDPKVAPIVLLIRERATIGRKAENSLQIDNKGVSGTHVEILRHERKCTLRDLDSSNGTAVNGREVREVELKNGDTVVLGKVAKLFFIDPLGQPAPSPNDPSAGGASGSPAPRAESPVSMAAPVVVPPPQAASSAAGASDRGTFEPIGEAQENLAGTWGINLVIAFVVAGALIAGGYLLSDFLKQGPADGQGQASVPPALADAALSFESDMDAQGNPPGWVARYEAPGSGKVELSSDSENPGDGSRSLRIKQTQSDQGAGMLILVADKPRDLQLSGTVQLSMLVRGEGVSTACVACALESEGVQQTAVAASLKDLSQTAWKEIRATGILTQASPKLAKLAILISGSFTRLWIDRVQLTKVEQPGAVAASLSATTSGDLTLTCDAARPGETVLLNANGNKLRFTPRVLTSNDRELSEPGFWAVGAQDKSSVVFQAALPSRGSVAALDLHPELCASEHLAEPGLRVQYLLHKNFESDTLALDVQFSPGTSTVTISDMRGTPLTVNLAEFHGFPYSTVTEVAVESQGLCVVFPRGAVLWLDQSRKGMLVATVRAAQEARRNEVVCDVYPRSVSTARLFARLVSQAESFDSRELFSAALARYEYILANAPAGLPCAAGVKDRIAKIRIRRDELFGLVKTAYAEAKDTRTADSIELAQRNLNKFVAEFPGDAEVSKLESWVKDLSDWRAAIKSTRPPEEAAKATLDADGFLRRAKDYQKQGHTLLALALLENILQDYKDTPSFLPAKTLHDEIMNEIQDPAKRDEVIDRELAIIDKASDDGDWAAAMERCQNLFKRFPDTSRNRDIMKRVRRIEERFD